MAAGVTSWLPNSRATLATVVRCSCGWPPLATGKVVDRRTLYIKQSRRTKFPRRRPESFSSCWLSALRYWLFIQHVVGRKLLSRRISSPYSKSASNETATHLPPNQPAVHSAPLWPISIDIELIGSLVSVTKKIYARTRIYKTLSYACAPPECPQSEWIKITNCPISYPLGTVCQCVWITFQLDWIQSWVV